MPGGGILGVTTSLALFEDAAYYVLAIDVTCAGGGTSAIGKPVLL